MTRRPGNVRRGDDEGVSVIIGAILLTAIILGSVVMVQLTYVPVWQEENEAKQAQRAMNGMMTLNGDISTSLQNGTRGVLTSPIDLQRDSSNPLAGSTFFHSLVFKPGAHRQSTLDLSARTFLQQTVNGSVVGEVIEDWKSQSIRTETNILQVTNFRINVTDSTPADGDAVNVTVADANGDNVGRARVYLESAAPDCLVKLRIRALNADPPRDLYHNTIHSQQNQNCQQNWQTQGFYVNLLDPSFRFDVLLANAEVPLTVTAIQEGLQADTAISYLNATTTTVTGEGAGGISFQNFSKTYRPGQLTYEGQNSHYPSYDIVLENGAVILSQSDGTVFRVDPPISIKNASDKMTVTMNFPSLEGSSTSFTGSPTAIVQTVARDSLAITGVAGTLNLTIPTDFPSLWAEFLYDEVDQAGYNVTRGTGTPCDPAATGCEAFVQENVGTGNVTLYLFGPTPEGAGPDNPVYDITLNLRAGTIDTAVLS